MACDADATAQQDVTLEMLQEELKCTICLELVHSVRELADCGHTFCEMCLEEAVRKGDGSRCPTCRTPFTRRKVCRMPLLGEVTNILRQQEDLGAVSKPIEVEALVLASRPPAVNELEEASCCVICFDPIADADDELLLCDGPGCETAVHLSCYRVGAVPQGEWLCDSCAEKGEKPACKLCPSERQLALRRTTCGNWVHVMCAMWQPMIVANPGEKIKITPAERHAKQWARFEHMKCSICINRKRFKEAGVGPKVQCSASRCRKPLHVTCAFEEGALDATDEGFKLYCPAHRHLAAEQEAPEPPLCILMSGAEEQHLQLAEAVVSFAGGSVVLEFDSHVTHLVVGSNVGDKPKRTIKYLEAILRQVDVVSWEWLQECKARNDVAEPDQFRVTPQWTALAEEIRDEPSRIFEKVAIAFDGDFCTPRPSRGDIRKLVELGGGVVIDSADSAGARTLVRIAGDGAVSDDAVTFKWLVESIEKNSVQALPAFRNGDTAARKRRRTA